MRPNNKTPLYADIASPRWEMRGGLKNKKTMAENTSLRSRMIAMQPGDKLTVPLEKYAPTTVRSYVSDLNFLYMRRYTAERNRETRTYTISRLS